jgi:hypothetical protein
MTRVVLAAAHLDSDPTNNRMKNLRALCQRCGRTIWRSAGPLTGGGWQPAIFSSVRIRH